MSARITMARSSRESKVFFPWERRKGVFGILGRARVRLVLAAVVVVSLLLWIHAREEKAAGVRATRAAMDNAYRAVWSFRADHGGACPKDMNELLTGAYVRDLPIDAWGRPLRLTCPGRRDPQGFEISSDGPDGLPGGLDRVE